MIPFAVTLALVLGLAACATMPPEQAAQEALMWEAARECQTRFGTIQSIERIDNYGRLHFTHAGSGSENTAFLACYTEAATRKLEAAGYTGRGTITPATRRTGTTRVPVTIASNATRVPVTLNGSHAATLLLDTGATTTILSKAVARRLGISPPIGARLRIVYVAGGTTISVPFVRLRSLQAGDATVQDLDIGVYDVVPHLPDVDGLLGADFLRHFRVSLDQERRLLTLEVPAAPASAPPSPVAAGRPGLAGVSAPVWKIGDRWTFRWESPRGSGTFVWTVTRQDAADAVDCYVIRSGKRDIYYRRSDLAFVLERFDEKIERRAAPATLLYDWPLVPGKSWEERYTSERPLDQQTRTYAIRSTVEAEETVSVPAGTFQALRIVRRHVQGAAISHESWYAPEVRQWVRQRERLDYGILTRELTGYEVR